MDLNTVAKKALENVIASGKIEQAIEAQIEKTITQLLNEELRPYSEFGKSIEKAVRNSLKIHGNVTLPEYNEQILKVMRKLLAAKTNAVIQKQVADQMAELLTPAPESIKISELIAKYVQHVEEQKKGEVEDNGGYYEDGEIRLIYQNEYGFHRFGLHPDHKNERRSLGGKSMSRFDCDIQFSIHDGLVCDLRFNRKEVEAELFSGPFHDFERMLFQMKAAQTKVEFDVPIGEIDTCYSGSVD